MCIYTVKKQKVKKNCTNSSRRVRNSTERLKIKRFRRKGYRKKLTKIEACHVAYRYIEYTVLFHWNILL